MYAFLISTGVVALAEMGDKTQLLALLLAARYQRPLPIILAILVATIFNHALAGLLGTMLAQWLSPTMLGWILVVSFLAMAIWMLIPDSIDDEVSTAPKHGVFLTTLLLFFLAEMGDKTQIATVALAAEYQAFVSVVLGTTLGMMLANVPAVFLGNKFAGALPTQWVHRIVAGIFLLLAVAAASRLLWGE